MGLDHREGQEPSEVKLSPREPELESLTCLATIRAHGPKRYPMSQGSASGTMTAGCFSLCACCSSSIEIGVAGIVRCEIVCVCVFESAHTCVHVCVHKCVHAHICAACAGSRADLQVWKERWARVWLWRAY